MWKVATRAPVMKLEARQAKRIITVARLHVTQASFKDSHATSDDRTHLHASGIHACVRRQNAGAKRYTCVI